MWWRLITCKHPFSILCKLDGSHYESRLCLVIMISRIFDAIFSSFYHKRPQYLTQHFHCHFNGLSADQSKSNIDKGRFILLIEKIQVCRTLIRE